MKRSSLLAMFALTVAVAVTTSAFATNEPIPGVDIIVKKNGGQLQAAPPAGGTGTPPAPIAHPIVGFAPLKPAEFRAVKGSTPDNSEPKGVWKAPAGKTGSLAVDDANSALGEVSTTR